MASQCTFFFEYLLKAEVLRLVKLKKPSAIYNVNLKKVLIHFENSILPLGAKTHRVDLDTN